MPQKITDTEKATYLDRTTELLNRVKNGTLPMPVVLAGLQKLVEGSFGSKIVDLDADPFVPNDWSVEKHRKGGVFDFDPSKIALYLSQEQKGNKLIGGNKLRTELDAQPVYNANLLDWLLCKEHQHLIPNEWKDKNVLFWGTIYRNHSGNLFVRYLYWRDSAWCWFCGFGRLGGGWGFDSPAAVFVS